MRLDKGQTAFGPEAVTRPSTELQLSEPQPFHVFSLRLDPKLLDDWPPLFNISLLQTPQSFGRLLVLRNNLPSEVDEPRSRRGISQGVNDSSIKSTDYVLGRALWGEKPIPT
jgi:hypothetical protein